MSLVVVVVVADHHCDCDVAVDDEAHVDCRDAQSRSMSASVEQSSSSSICRSMMTKMAP